MIELHHRLPIRRESYMALHWIPVLLMLLVCSLYSHLAPAVSASTPHVRTWHGTVDGVPLWVTVVAKDYALGRPQGPWWHWGNTATDTYLLAVGHPNQVRLILSFDRQRDGLPEAKLYAGVYNRDHGNEPLRYTLRDGRIGVLSAARHPYLTIRPHHGGWLVDGKPNYHLTVLVDGPTIYGVGPANAPTDGTIDAIINVGGRHGRPRWETQRLGHDPAPTAPYSRFSATKRMSGAPPLMLLPPLMPTFPYLGAAARFGDQWLSGNPPPCLFVLHPGLLLLQSFVGFKNAGTYWINSVSPPPRTDFESPFAFYNFLPSSRYSQLVIRADQFPPGDRHGYAPHRSQQTAFRYSWKMRDPARWIYSLELEGFHPLADRIRVGRTAVRGISPVDLPDWVIGKSWPYATFVQAMPGFTGSEGIYFYGGVDSAEDWKWLTGSALSSPGYLKSPLLPHAAELTRIADYGLPAGFRGEYSAHLLYLQAELSSSKQ
jgi:hypothetical protein